MSMKVNVIYRGIVYRVRGIRILCSVVTAVIVLLLTLIGLGVWMLISAYGEDKFTPASVQGNKSEKTESESDSFISTPINNLTPSIDFNQPLESQSIDSRRAEVPMKTSLDPDLIAVPNEVHEAIGHFQALIPNTNNHTELKNRATSEVANNYLNDKTERKDVYQFNDTILNIRQNLTDFADEYIEEEMKYSDSLVEYSDIRPVYVVPSPSSDTQQSVREIEEPISHVVTIGVNRQSVEDNSWKLKDGESNVDIENEQELNEAIQIGPIELENNNNNNKESQEEVSENIKYVPTRKQITSTLPSKQLNWQTKMGAILGLPQHLMPKRTQNYREPHKEHKQEDLPRDVEDSTELKASSRSDMFLLDNSPSESQFYSSAYPMKDEAAYPNLENYNSANRNRNVPKIKSPTVQQDDSSSEQPPVPEISKVSADLQPTNNWYDHKVGISEPKPQSPYEGPPVVGYGKNPFSDTKLNPELMFGHFWDIYNNSDAVPQPHDDRGPVPEDTKIVIVNQDVRDNNKNKNNNRPVPSVRGSVPYSDFRQRPLRNDPIRRLWNNGASNNNQNNYHRHENPPDRTYHSSKEVYERRPVTTYTTSGGQYTTRSTYVSAEVTDRHGKYPNPPRQQNRPSRLPPRQSNTSNRPPPRRKRPLNYGNRPNQYHFNRRNGLAENNQAQTNTNAHNIPQTTYTVPNGVKTINQPPLRNNQQEVLTTPQKRPVVNRTPLHRPTPYQSRPPPPSNNLGPLQGIYDYSTRIANTIISFPNDIVNLMKNSSDGYLGTAVKLLQDYNTVFNGIDTKVGETDIYGNDPNRDERLILPGVDQLRSLDPFQMSLVTWTFLDFWEFLIEKVGTLSTTDLNVLENRLDRLRVEKNNLMARSIANAAIYQLSVNKTFDTIFHLPEVNKILISLKDIIQASPEGTAIIEGRLFDPLGLFNSQQRVQFIQFAVKVLLKFGKVYIQKSYALDCMMLLFCKELNQHTKKQGLDGLSAKLKTVGLKVLTDREDRETDTIGDIWRAISAFSPLQCDVMFPKCDGSKALEIVNDVASGSE